jgi:hypothetical protein
MRNGSSIERILPVKVELVELDMEIKAEVVAIHNSH